MRIGIIGSGGIAGAHAERYKKVDGVEVVAVCDVVPGRAEAFIERFGFDKAKPYTDTKEMLKADFAGVSICTFNAAHYQPTMEALAAGKHVLLEKPMAATLGQAKEMLAASQSAGKILSIGFQSRFERRTRLAKRLIDEGQLGKVYYVETGGGRRKGIPGGTFVSKATAAGGAILDIGCYSLDTAMYLLGHPRPLTVSAYTSNYFGTSPVYSKTAAWGAIDPQKFDVEDFGVAFIRLDGDIVLLFKISWAMHLDTLGRTFFLGTERGLDLDGMQLYSDVAGRSARTELELEGRGGDPFLRKIETFVEAVRDNGPAPIPASEVIRSQAILDAIYRSAAEQREVAVEAV